MYIQPIETERLLLRPFVEADWPSVYAYAADAAVMRYMAEGRLETEVKIRAFIEKNSGEEAEALPVILKSEDQLIGHMSFHPWFAPHTYEVGWVIHPAYQRRGYAAEAASALLRYGFETLKAHRVIATCQPENPASYRVMEKIGMRREGHFKKCIDRGEGLWWDEYFYAILEEEWLKETQMRRDL